MSEPPFLAARLRHTSIGGTGGDGARSEGVNITERFPRSHPLRAIRDPSYFRGIRAFPVARRLSLWEGDFVLKCSRSHAARVPSAKCAGIERFSTAAGEPRTCTARDRNRCHQWRCLWTAGTT